MINNSSAYKSCASLLLVGFTAFLAISLFSYFPEDPSPYSASIPEIRPLNLGGKLGAKLSAYAFITFGAVSFLAAPLLLALAAAIVVRPSLGKLTLDAIRKIIIFIGALCIAPLVRETIEWKDYTFLISGRFGKYCHQFVEQQFGPVGQWILVFLVFAIIQSDRTLRLVAKAHVWLKSLKWPSAKLPSFKWRKSPESPPVATEAPPVAVTMPLNVNEPVIVAENPILPEADDDEPQIVYPQPSGAAFQISQSRSQDPSRKTEYQKVAEELKKAFADFGVQGDIVGFQTGPVVTVYEYEPGPGIKLSKLTSLESDLALALKVDSVFIHPVSGKKVVGVQVPNSHPEMVMFGDLIHTHEFQNRTSPLTFAIGKNLNGEPVCEDLATMPHLLMAGQTGSGKSVAINTMLCSILMKASPDQVRLILVDPKVLELKVYEGIPHLLIPVITEPAMAQGALQWACAEMDRRYRIMEFAKIRNIQGFNAYWQSKSDLERVEIRKQCDLPQLAELPYLVIVIDELADLMLTGSKDVESSIQRLAQKARACGIHLVLATQRPSVDVITGVIKANLPSRIAFKVFSRTDARTILDTMGAERLIGKGDMLYLRTGSTKLDRIQGAFVSDKEVNDFIQSIKNQSPTLYDEEAIAWINQSKPAQKEPFGNGYDMDGSLDEFWRESCQIAQTQGAVSASFLQRQLKIGYNRAARIVETMESMGLVTKADGVKPRKWLASASDEIR